MELQVAAGNILDYAGDAIIVNLLEGVTEPTGAIGAVDAALDGLIRRLIAAGEIKGKANEATLIHTHGRLPAERVLVVGLGPQQDMRLATAIEAAGTAARYLARRGCRRVATILHGGGAGGYLPHAAARAVVQGALLGLYNGDEFKTSDRGPADLDKFAIIEFDAAKVAAIEAGARGGQVMAEATNFARTLVNEPANEMTPTRLAAVAAEEADAHGIDFQVIEAEEAARLGMGCYLAVASGSAQPPKFIVLRYSPISEGPLIGLVGKGITFDSGGVSIKLGEGLEKMKSDMAGAAAVLAAVVAAARLKLETRLLAVLPAVENMPGGRAYRPGDVLQALGGKTVEVISTDAEGRLILADALGYARQQGATHLVDVATLTGGCVIALGHVTTGLFSNDDDLCAAILEAGERAGERLWRLPLFPEYRTQLKSQIADVKNEGGRPAAPITGAVFLEEFVESLPWAHLDIAGTSWNEKEKPYLAEGATGAPTGTLIELLERIARGPRPVR